MKKTFLGQIILASAFVSVFFILPETVLAQISEASSQKARNTIKPKAKPATKKIDYNKAITITRVEKKSRRNYRKPNISSKNIQQKKVVKRVKVLPLAIQLRLLLLDEEGKEMEISPYNQFTTSDRLRLSLKANQRGYLYVIRQSSPDSQGEIIFPTPLVNNGSNYIAANREYILPSNCPKNIKPMDCSLQLLSVEQAPQEFFTVLFTRDSLVDLPNDARQARVSLKRLTNDGKIPYQTLIDLIEESGQDLVLQPGDTSAALRIINQNKKDNEEIIETFIIDKAK